MAVPLVVAVLVGIGIAFQAVCTGRQSSSTPPLAVSLALTCAGAGIGGVWAFLTGTWHEVTAMVVHWWWLPLGAFGWLVVGGIGYASHHLGAPMALALVVGAQVITSLLAHAAGGQRNLRLSDAVAVVLLVAGVLLIARPATGQ